MSWDVILAYLEEIRKMFKFYCLINYTRISDW